MLHRPNFLLPRGSAIKSFRFSLSPTPSRNFSFSTSSTRPRASQHPKTFILCAFGGLVVVASKREDTEDMAAPGRPGNLTYEQGVKLKEMWSTAFKVFGIHQDRVAPELENDNESNREVSRTGTDISDGQPKKGKLALFKRTKDPEASSTPTQSTTVILSDVSKLSIADGDDKYSQTKEFREAIATSTPQEIHDAFWRMVKPDHPDSLFLRFLRARKWDVNKAIVMLVATLRWRIKDIDVLPFLIIRLITGGRSYRKRRITFCRDKGRWVHEAAAIRKILSSWS